MNALQFASRLLQSIDECLAEGISVQTGEVTIFSHISQDGITLRTTIGRHIPHIGDVSVMTKQFVQKNRRHRRITAMSMTMIAHKQYNERLNRFLTTGHDENVSVQSQIERELIYIEAMQNGECTDDDIIDEFFPGAEGEEREELLEIMNGIDNLCKALAEERHEG